MKLRPYQEQAVAAVFSRWNGGDNSTLLILPTGCGKTVVFSAIAQECVSSGKRVLILAHRGELLDQAADKLRNYTKDDERGIPGLLCAVEKADSTCLGSFYRVVLGSVQTLKVARLKRFPREYFDIIIIDEAHHSQADSYKRILEYFSKAKILGVTATPDRSDKKQLQFDSTAFLYSIKTAVSDGYLCPIQSEIADVEIDLTAVRTTKGDYNENDLGNAIEPYLEKIAAVMAEKCRDKKTVVFLPLVRISKKMRDILNGFGFRAAEVNGASTDRAEILKGFAENKYNVICNAMLLTEGWDCPDVDCIVILRPTKIRSLYVQMLGRGLRLADGKKYLYQLDFFWQTKKFKLFTPADVVGEQNVIKEEPEKLLDDAKEKEQKPDREGSFINALKNAHDDIEYQRKLQGMPTLKQAEILRRYGFIDVDEWSRREAGSIISQIAQNGWKLPEWIDKPSEYVPPSLRFDNYYKSLEWNDAI